MCISGEEELKRLKKNLKNKNVVIKSQRMEKSMPRSLTGSLIKQVRKPESKKGETKIRLCHMLEHFIFMLHNV